jgi:hypothetical protein
MNNRFFLDHKLENSNHCRKNLSDLMEKCEKDIPRKHMTVFLKSHGKPKPEAHMRIVLLTCLSL